MNKYSIWISMGIVAITTTIRAFLEFFSNPEPLQQFSPWFVTLNYFLFFFATIVGIGYLVSKLTNESPLKWTRKMANYSPIIFLAPIIDIIASQGSGICMAYSGSGGALLIYDLFTYFGKITQCGISIGMRIEIAFILIAIGRIIWKKTNSIIKTEIGVLGSYLFIFALCALPGVLAALGGSFDYNAAPWITTALSQSLIGSAHGYINSTGDYSVLHGASILFARIELIILIALGILIATEQNRQHVVAWIKNSRWERLLYYLFLAVTGSLVANHYHTITYNWIDMIGAACAIVSIISAFWSAVVWNDINDVSIDAISNQNRPLLVKSIDKSSYTHQGIFFFLVSLVSALLVSYPFFFCILLLQITYGIYSYKETLWKKHFFSSAMSIGFIGTTIFISGFLFSEPHQSLALIPLDIVLIIFGTITIISSAKDFKDVAGDKANNIKTLPVLFGRRKASLILSVTLIVWLLIIALYKESWVIAAQALPWIVIDLILRKRIPEYIRFLVFIAQIVIIALVFI